MKLSQCFNWKVIAGVIGVLAVVYIFRPEYIIRFLPLLVVLICPLSMLFMMKGMHGSTPEQPKNTNEQPSPEKTKHT